MATSVPLWRADYGALAMLAGAAALAVLAACDPPLNLGQPTTRALESSAADTLTAASSFEITGSYIDQSSGPASSARTNAPGASVAIDMEVARSGAERVVVNAADAKLEAIIFGKEAYFRGNQFLSQHMGADPLSRNLVRAAGNAWWRGSATDFPRLPDFTDGSTFRTTFLGTAVTQRSDHLSVDGIAAINLSGPRADVFVAAAPPYRVLRVHLKQGVVIDGIGEADLRFTNFNRDFGIAAPADVIDFSNLSTLPPIYSVVSVDTSGCGSTCVVSAMVKNLGGMHGARAPSTITFTMTNTASGNVTGSCQAQVVPDVGYNATATVSCTIGNLSGEQQNAAIVTAAADNPGHA